MTKPSPHYLRVYQTVNKLWKHASPEKQKPSPKRTEIVFKDSSNTRKETLEPFAKDANTIHQLKHIVELTTVSTATYIETTIQKEAEENDIETLSPITDINSRDSCDPQEL